MWNLSDKVASKVGPTPSFQQDNVCWWSILQRAPRVQKVSSSTAAQDGFAHFLFRCNLTNDFCEQGATKRVQTSKHEHTPCAMVEMKSQRRKAIWATSSPLLRLPAFIFPNNYFLIQMLNRSFRSIRWKTLCKMKNKHYAKLNFGSLQWMNVPFSIYKSMAMTQGNAEVIIIIIFFWFFLMKLSLSLFFSPASCLCVLELNATHGTSRLVPSLSCIAQQ